MQSLYLLINFCTVIIPFAFSFHPKLKFSKHWRTFFPAMLLAAIPFLIWDSIFTQMEVWGFNSNYISGWFLYNLPLEEVLFFFCIPYACVFTYHCLNILIFKHHRSTREFASPILIILLLLLAYIYKDKLYTSITFLSLGVLIFLSKYILKFKYLKKFYLSYSVLLIPFLIVNGILTGSWLDEPLVWYNEKEIIGLRLLSIPIEDVFYGMELILLNILLFHYLSDLGKLKSKSGSGNSDRRKI